MPQWLLSTSMLSVLAEGLSTHPCHAQMPSLRLKIAVVGTGGGSAIEQIIAELAYRLKQAPEGSAEAADNSVREPVQDRCLTVALELSDALAIACQ